MEEGTIEKTNQYTLMHYDRRKIPLLLHWIILFIIHSTVCYKIKDSDKLKQEVVHSLG